MSAYSGSPDKGTSAAVTSHSMRRLGSAMGRLLYLCARRGSSSKILLTSRVAPVDLEDQDGHLLPGVETLQLGPLEENAARQFFAHLRIEQSPELMTLARRFEFHPLLLSLLARRLAGGQPLREQLPEDLPLRISARKLIDASIGELKPEDRIVAEQVAAFEGPVHYSDLIYAGGEVLLRAIYRRIGQAWPR